MTSINRVCALAFCIWAGPAAALATSVTVAGDLQSELGCVSDYDPACTQTAMTYDPTSDIWRLGNKTLPGSATYQYWAAIDGLITGGFGLNGASPGGLNPVTISTPPVSTTVSFYYDDKTHWIADSVNAVIAVAAGSFQSELGCTGDFEPTCFRSWLQDLTGSGFYQFVTAALPAGSYSTVVALNESFDVSYGAGGVPGVNIDFTVAATGTPTLFCYDSLSHVMTVGAAAGNTCGSSSGGSGGAVPAPGSMCLLGIAFLGLVRTRRRPHIA